MADEKTPETPKLSTELDGKFKMSHGFAPGRYTFKGVSIDTRKCSVVQAESFHALGSNLLIKIDKAVEPKKS